MFENILGNDNIKKYLINCINNKNFSHSYIFSGNKGVGKYTLAKEFAKMILEDDMMQDYYELKPDGKSLKIAQIRDLQAEINIKPVVSEKSVYIIDDADLMTVEAQNSLLKTLEEPPKYVTIVLTAKTLNNILDTIKSRCQKIYLAEKLDKKQIHDNQEEKVKEYSEKVKNDILNILENTKILKKTQFYAKYSDILTKDNILEILDVLEDIIYENILLYNDMYKIIVEARRRIKINCNFEMTKDYLILNIWDKSNIERK